MVLAGCTHGTTDNQSPSTSGSTGGPAGASGSAQGGSAGAASPGSSAGGSATGTSSGGSHSGNTSADGTSGDGASASSGGGSGTGGGVTAQLAAEVPTAASLAAVRKGLPSDPVRAIDALVAKVFDPDEKVATAATAEILRRAGLPLVSAAQPVLALPDTNVIVNHQIPVELIPSLTEAVRFGQRYTPAQVGKLLELAGATHGAFTGKQIVAILAAWGKDPKDPPEVVAAGAAERALSLWHHQLLVPSNVVDSATEQKARAHPDKASAATLAALHNPHRVLGLDPLQAIVLIAHATSYVERAGTVAASVQGPASPSESRGAATETPSAPGLRQDATQALVRPRSAIPALTAPHDNGFCGFLDYGNSVGSGGAHAGETTGFRQALDQVIKRVIELGEDVAKAVGAAFALYDIAADTLTTVLMMTGIEVQISPDPVTTHFRHRHGDKSRDVGFTATVSFRSALQGKNGQYHGCWRFAGIAMPQNGPVKNWLVHWKVSGPVVVLQDEPAKSYQYFGSDKPTNADGKSWTQMMPRTESKPPPPPQPQHVIFNEVAVQPSPNQQLVQKGDIWTALGAFLDPIGAIITELEQVTNRFVRDVAMPYTAIPYPVDYHQKEPYTIKSDGFLTIPLYAGINIGSDLYSCNGPAGPWKGTVSFSVKAGGSVKAMEELFGVHGQDSGSFTEPISFSLDLDSGARQQIHIPTKSGDMGLWLQLDQAAVQRALHAKSTSDDAPAVVGNGSWTFGGEDVTLVSQLLGPGFSNGLALPVVATPLDPRCKGGTLADDTFDED